MEHREIRGSGAPTVPESAPLHPGYLPGAPLGATTGIDKLFSKE
jgi:hypothetical protein